MYFHSITFIRLSEAISKTIEGQIGSASTSRHNCNRIFLFYSFLANKDIVNNFMVNEKQLNSAFRKNRKGNIEISNKIHFDTSMNEAQNKINAYYTQNQNLRQNASMSRLNAMQVNFNFLFYVCKKIFFTLTS
jgi:hypothetical protein